MRDNALFRAVWRGLLILALGLPALRAQAQDDPPGRVGRVAEVRGEAWFYDAESRDWQAARINRPLTRGDRVSTGDRAQLDLRVGSTWLRLDARSEVEVQRLDDERMEFVLHEGTLALRVRSADNARELQVNTTEGRFGPVTPGLFRLEQHADTTSAAAWRGSLRFDAPDSSFTLGGGQSADFWADGPQRRTHYTWTELPRDSFGTAVLRDDEREERLGAPRYVSPEMTGAEELERNGRWQSHPEFGSVWVPSGVPSDWAPYRQGHWSWVEPWGWTWVDDAPWGFATSHYGRWLWWGGRWCWTPGRVVARPVWAPALVGWVGGPQVGVSISIGSRPLPAVGWVPLAPRETFHPPYRFSPGYFERLNDHDRGRGWRALPRPVPDGPVRYGNQGVPDAVTMVPADVWRQRQPVAPARRIEPAMPSRGEVHERPRQPLPVAPPAPPTRVVEPPSRMPPAPWRGEEPRREGQPPRERRGEPVPPDARPQDGRRDGRQDGRQDNRQEFRPVPRAPEAPAAPPAARPPEPRAVQPVPPAPRAPEVRREPVPAANDIPEGRRPRQGADGP